VQFPKKYSWILRFEDEKEDVRVETSVIKLFNYSKNLSERAQSASIMTRRRPLATVVKKVEKSKKTENMKSWFMLIKLNIQSQSGRRSLIYRA
jgi:hypothetical protein